MKTPVAGDDHMTGYADWLAIQSGNPPSASINFDPTHRYQRNGRDLGEWVHIDVLFQAYFNALLILFRLGAPFDQANPYNSSLTQIGFGTLGQPYMASVLAAVAREALKEVWFQKWFVHRRLRPEAFAGRLHNHVLGAASYPIHADALNSPVLNEVFTRYGSYLLPMAFPEGCPTHPAYGAGHATVAGACVTVLKALFDEEFVIPDPVEASPDGLSHVPYSGPPLTVGGELNKLASNVAIGRNLAGVHWRSDATESLKLGEQLAIRYLKDERRTFSEKFRGFTLRKFDGTLITVTRIDAAWSGPGASRSGPARGVVGSAVGGFGGTTCGLPFPAAPRASPCSCWAAPDPGWRRLPASPGSPIRRRGASPTP
jgi:hypothetical protein